MPVFCERSICESTDGAETFHLVGGVGQDGTATSLTSDPFRPGVFSGSFTDNVVSCGENAHAMVSGNSGGTWTVVSRGAQFAPISDLTAGPEILFAATQGTGAFSVSINGGIFPPKTITPLVPKPSRVHR
jgi:hypothetical protein